MHTLAGSRRLPSVGGSKLKEKEKEEKKEKRKKCARHAGFGRGLSDFVEPKPKGQSHVVTAPCE
jgi:hypothetical protein